jgi:outer membrane lipoprotein-sorting protein
MIFFSVQLFSQEKFTDVADIDAFKSKMKEASANTKTIECSFVQEKNIAALSDVIKSGGHFWFKKDNKMRWEYQEPFEYVIAINETEMWIKDDEELKKYDMKSNQMFQQINKMMVGTVNGDILNSNEFNFKYQESEQQYKIYLTPKSEAMKDFLSTIILFLDKKDFSVNELHMLESGSDNTVIKFSDKKLNQDIPNDNFTLK